MPRPAPSAKPAWRSRSHPTRNPSASPPRSGSRRRSARGGRTRPRGPGAGHRLDARGGLRPAGPPPPGRCPLVPRRDDVQPRRILSDQPARPAELPGLHAPAPPRPGGHRGERGPRARRDRPRAFAVAHAAEFDRWIEADGGLDLQLLGIGRNGHIGFNEPSDLDVADALRLPTRLVDLHPVTRADASREFGSEDAVIPRALTMGVATILAARSILILATGAHKAEAVAAALTGPMTAAVPASLLQSVARPGDLDPRRGRGPGTARTLARRPRHREIDSRDPLQPGVLSIAPAPGYWSKGRDSPSNPSRCFRGDPDEAFPIARWEGIR